VLKGARTHAEITAPLRSQFHALLRVSSGTVRALSGSASSKLEPAGSKRESPSSGQHTAGSGYHAPGPGLNRTRSRHHPTGSGFNHQNQVDQDDASTGDQNLAEHEWFKGHPQFAGNFVTDHEARIGRKTDSWFAR
jgi:hypothetical protein